MGTEYDAPDFIARLEAALHEHRTGKKLGVGVDRSIPGSFNDLIAAWYQSAEWSALADLIKKTYRVVIEPFREEHGDKPFNRFERRHMMQILAKKAKTPAAVNNLRKRLGQVLDHAIA